MRIFGVFRCMHNMRGDREKQILEIYFMASSFFNSFFCTVCVQPERRIQDTLGNLWRKNLGC